jgi:hypothetical protein
MGAYAPTTEKTFSKRLKNSRNFFSIYVSIFYVHTSCFAENRHFLCLVLKRQKNVSCNANFSIKICLFYAQHKKCHFLVKQLCENIECQDLRANFFVDFFYKLCLKHISKTRSICSRVPKRRHRSIYIF